MSEPNTPHSIIICGAGGSGLPALMAIAEARRNQPKETAKLRVTIIDPDKVALSNLNRQILFRDQDLGKDKALLAKTRIEELYAVSSEQLEVVAIQDAVTRENIEEYFRNGTVIIDCTDSVPTKLLLNDYCVTHGQTLCSTGVVGEGGYVLHIDFRSEKRPACLRCLFDTFTDEDFLNQERSCHSAGIFGPAASLVGLIGGTLALRSGSEDLPQQSGSQLIRVSLENPEPHIVKVSPSASCVLGCGEEKIVPVDLRDLECPSTFLYTKLALERHGPGITLDLRYGNEQSVQRVAQSCEELGFPVASRGRLIANGEWRLLLRTV